MAYQFPLNGGRINATIGGNTDGVGSLVSTGTMTLAGGSNITLSQNAGNAITIHGAAGGGGGAAISAAGASASNGTVVFSNSNGVGFGMNGSTITASHNGITSQSAQTLGLYASGANTIGQSSSSTLDARSFNFSGQGAISAGYSGGTMQLSVPQTSSLSATGAVSISSAGNTIYIGALTSGGGAALSAGTQSVSTGTVEFANSNGITFGMSGSNQITASHNGLTSQSVQTQNMVSVQGSTGDISFANGGGVTFGGNASTLTASVNTSYAASNHSHGDPTLALTNLSGTTASASNGLTLSLSAAAPGGGGGGIALSGGGTSYSNGTVHLSNHGGALTITGSTNSVLSISVPQTSSLSATGAVSISTDGSTIYVGAPLDGGPALSHWEYPEGFFTSLSNMGNGSLSINHMYVPFNVTGTAMKIGGSLSAATNTSVTTASANLSLWMGIYTLNGSSLSLASSGSANNGFQWSVSNSSTANTSINSMRQLTVPMNINMTPGEYWVAAVISTATTYTGFTFTMYGNDRINPATGAALLTPIGSNTTAARGAMLMQGIYSAGTSAGPATMSAGHILQSAASVVMRANYYHAIYNATY